MFPSLSKHFGAFFDHFRIRWLFLSVLLQESCVRISWLKHVTSFWIRSLTCISLYCTHLSSSYKSFLCISNSPAYILQHLYMYLLVDACVYFKLHAWHAFSWEIEWNKSSSFFLPLCLSSSYVCIPSCVHFF